MSVNKIPYDLSNIINNRRSARSFKTVPIKQETMTILSEFSKEIKLPFDCDTEIRFFRAEPTKKLYTTMQSPADNVAFLSKTDVVSIAKTGFVGELLILLAESLGVSTCWYGHFKLSELERLMPHLQTPSQLKEAPNGFGYAKGVTDGIRAICISPLGYYEQNGLRILDRITKNKYSFNRREIKGLLEKPEDINHLSDNLLYALDLGRKAPSAGNSQMWRFSFDNDYKTILISMPVGYKHFKWEHPNVDVGICASHIWLALMEKGFAPKVGVYEDLERAIFEIKVA